MTRAHYRDVQHRFTHIDGEVTRVAVELRPGEEASTATVALRFYPWWEHPLYVAARARGADWGFATGDDAAREVVVEAIGPVLCDVRPATEAIDIAFSTDDPVLWQLEREAQVFCNSDFDYQSFLSALGEHEVSHGLEGSLLGYMPHRLKHQAPFSLGYFPVTVCRHVTSVLRGMGVQLFSAGDLPAPEPLVAFSIGGHSTIVARNFFLEVPDFEHRPEWFRPSGRQGQAR